MTAAVFYVCVGHTTDATNGVNQGLVASRSGSQIKGAARCAHTTLYLVSYLSPGADTHRPPPCRSCPSRRCAPDARPGCRATAPGQSSRCRQGETEAGESLQIVIIFIFFFFSFIKSSFRVSPVLPDEVQLLLYIVSCINLQP